jgi:hypothetical protein
VLPNAFRSSHSLQQVKGVAGAEGLRTHPGIPPLEGADDFRVGDELPVLLIFEVGEPLVLWGLQKPDGALQTCMFLSNHRHDLNLDVPELSERR